MLCRSLLGITHPEKLNIDAAASVKLWATEAQGRINDACVQLHGGYGYMGIPVARAWADSRVQRIYAGTSEIMKEIISRTILVGRSAFNVYQVPVPNQSLFCRLG